MLMPIKVYFLQKNITCIFYPAYFSKNRRCVIYPLWLVKILNLKKRIKFKKVGPWKSNPHHIVIDDNGHTITISFPFTYEKSLELFYQKITEMSIQYNDEYYIISRTTDYKNERK